MGGKEKDHDSNPRTGKQAAQFQGQSSHCAKWCHRRAECRERLARQNKTGAVAGVQEPEEQGVKSVHCSEAR